MYLSEPQMAPPYTEETRVLAYYPPESVHKCDLWEFPRNKKKLKTRNVINLVANEDVRKLCAFSLNQPQFPYWRPPLPVTSGHDDITSG